MKHKRGWIIVVVVLLLVIGGGLLCRSVSSSQPASVAKRFLQKHPFSYLYGDQAGGEKFSGGALDDDFVVPKTASGDKHVLAVTYSTDKSDKGFTFMDTDSDDLYWLGFGVDGKTKEIHFAYSNQADEEGGDGAYSEARATYTVTGTNTLHQSGLKLKPGNGDSKADLQKIVKDYQRVIKYTLMHYASVETLSKTQQYLQKNGSSVVASYNSSSKAARKKQDHKDKQTVSAFLKATYVPKYSAAKWKKYILIRAKQMGLTGIKVSSEEYRIDIGDYDYLSDYDNNRLASLYREGPDDYGDESEAPYGGTWNQFNGNQKGENRVFYVTDSKGVKYLAVLPVRLMTAKSMSSSKYGKTETNLFQSVTIGQIGDLKDYVRKNQKPNAAVIAKNIILVQPETDDE